MIRWKISHNNGGRGGLAIRGVSIRRKKWCPVKDCIFKLSDGRKLGYIEYGNSDGIPIFLLHGTPGSRVFGLENEPLIEEENLRVITPERPGYGLSSPLKGRSISCYSNDIEALADYLEIPKFHVAGVSGGGPYALACASILSSRVLSATLIASATPMEMEDYFKGMSIGNKFAFVMSKYLPWLLKPIYKYAAAYYRKKPEKLFEGLKSQLCEWDVKVMEVMEDKDQLKGFVDHICEAYKQGSTAAYTDTYLVTRPWGIDFSGINSPIFMWHGESDTLVPIYPAKKFAKALPNCHSHFVADAGHFLLESEEVGRSIIQAIKQIAPNNGN